MASRSPRVRLSLLAVTSVATAGGAMAAAPAHATVPTLPGPIITDTLTGTGATADAQGNLTVTAATLPYTVTVAYTATPMNSSPPTTVTSVNVKCPTAGVVVTAFDPATGKGSDTCTYSAPGSYQVLITGHDSMGNYTNVSQTVSVNQPPPPPPPSTAPTVQFGINPEAGATTDAQGDVTEALSHQGLATVSLNITATASKMAPSVTDIASATLDCGRPGEVPTQFVTGSPAAQKGGGVGGSLGCDYGATGTYTVTAVATDTQSPGKTVTVQHTVTVVAATAIGVDRYDGDSRYGTGVALSRAAFPTAGSAGAVILARGDVFADALAGIPLAKAKQAPLLLTPGGAMATAIDPNVEAELIRVLPRDRSHTVYILGGTGAVPQAVEDHVNALGYTVVRLSGASRFDTALAIAKDPRALNDPGNVVVARGDDFADALAAGPYATNIATGPSGAPAAIVLSDGTAATGKLDANSAAYVESKLAAAGSTVTAIGGGAQTALSALPGAAGKFQSLVGGDRYQTAFFVARKGWATDNGITLTFHAGIMGIATGSGFPDALTGGAYMALKNGPLLLTDPKATTPGQGALFPVQLGLNALTDVAVFGGTGVLPAAVQQATLTTVKSPASAYVDHHVVF